MIDFMKFRCKSCNKNRHHTEINVHKASWHETTFNINHCFDNEECKKKAIEYGVECVDSLKKASIKNGESYD